MTFRRSIMIVVVEIATVVVRSQDMTAVGHHFFTARCKPQTATRSVGEGSTVSILQ